MFEAILSEYWPVLMFVGIAVFFVFAIIMEGGSPPDEPGHSPWG